jgi:hypothetical protein
LALISRRHRIWLRVREVVRGEASSTHRRLAPQPDPGGARAAFVGDRRQERRRRLDHSLKPRPRLSPGCAICIRYSRVSSFYLHDEVEAIRFRLIGDFGEADARELERSWVTASSTLSGRRMVVDLSEIGSVDVVGRQLLRRLGARGAVFITATPASESLAREVPGRDSAGLPSKKPGIRARFRCWLGCCCRVEQASLRKCLPCRQGVRRIW